MAQKYPVFERSEFGDFSQNSQFLAEFPSLELLVLLFQDKRTFKKLFMGIFFLILGLIFIGIPVLLGIAIYYIPRKFGHPKFAKYALIIYCLSVGFIAINLIFEDEFFTKKDAKELVQEQGIKLHEPFELLQNKSSSAIGDYYHTFTLKINRTDKNQAINAIKNSTNFNKENLTYEKIDRYFGKKIINNYETKNAFVREYFEPSGKEGYAPTFRKLSFQKTTNELIFEDIDE